MITRAHARGEFFILMFLTFCITTLFIDCKMTNTNVDLLNVSSLFKS